MILKMYILFYPNKVKHLKYFHVGYWNVLIT